MNEDTNFHMTIENAYNYLGLNPSQKYTKEEVEEKYNKLANAISKEILLGNDSEDDLIISQLKNNLFLPLDCLVLIRYCYINLTFHS